MLAEGYSTREIAGLLHLAEGTVKNHISMVLQKLGARDRTSAVLRALREGILGSGRVPAVSQRRGSGLSARDHRRERRGRDIRWMPRPRAVERATGIEPA